MLAGLIGLVAVVSLILKLGPHYIDWRTMQSVFSALPASQVHTMTKTEIRESLQKRFRVNNLRDFDLKQIVKIERQKVGTIVSVNYERREPLLANVDAVLTFSEQYQFK
ncbi:MAG: DUF4845 domain-containing protein [Pseudomonadota bacterium]